MTSPQAAVLRRRLARDLKEARLAAGLKQQDVASAHHWSLSKVMRLESGENSVSKGDLVLLAQQFDVEDRLPEWTAVSLQARKLPFLEYSDLHDNDTLRFFAFETAAIRDRQFENEFVPGLLQIRAYAFASLRDAAQVPATELDRRVQARLERQHLLEDTDGKQFSFLVDQAVVSRDVGGRDVMRRQLEHLLQLMHGPAITLRVIPFTVGAHPGMRGPFVYLQFDEDEDDDMVYLEGATGKQVFASEPDMLERYRRRWAVIEALALSVDDTSKLLESRIGELRP